MRSILGASLDDQERLTLFEELCEELRAHAAAEEQTLYAELLAYSQQQIQRSVADNDEVVDLILQVQDLDIASADWLATFEVLKEKVERHLETEEALLFPLARTQIKRRRAKVLGERFEQLKQRELSIWGRQARKRRVIPGRRRLVTVRRLERQPTSAK
jgi:iron-sulfur cluster repair protein YtfE (RIC family)